MKRALLLVFLVLAACKHDAPKIEDAGATPPPAAAATFDGQTVVRGACLSCHTSQMLEQQRLTQAQWQKVVTKMVGWGANLEPSDSETLVKWLAESYGPDAGPWAPDTTTSDDAAKQLAPTPDGVFANGNAERGVTLYTDKCSGCHGSDARGHIGVLLVERPILGRALELANLVRRGKGKMTPMTVKDTEIADILAHLRALRNP